MSTLIQALYEGLINGTIYALIAMGIALVWGVMGILSFSQGEFLMIAMFVSYYFNFHTGLPPIVALPLCMIVLFFIGFGIYKTIIYKALKGPILSQRLVTFALSLVLVNIMLMMFGGMFKTIKNTGMDGSIQLANLVISKNRIFPLIIAVFVFTFMTWFLNRTVRARRSALLQWINRPPNWSV